MMFTAAHAIAQLDDALAKTGQTIGWAITANGVPAAATNHKAFVRGYKSDELVGGINQGDREVIMSPTGLIGLPKKNDRITIAGDPTTVQFKPEFVRMADTLVRIKLVARGL